MTQQVDRKGNFQGQIVEYGLRTYTGGSQAVSIGVKARIDAYWNGEAWEDWREYQMEASGYLFIVKKNGEVNNNQVESLVNFAGWDGSIDSITDNKWQPTPCQFSVEENEYQGKLEYRIGFVNEFDRVPGGGMSNVTEDKAKELKSRFGSSLRAIAGSAKRNAAPAPGKPMPTPKKPEPVTSPAGEDIPF